MPGTINSENYASLELQLVRNYEEFAGIDDRLQCYNKNEAFEDAINPQRRQKTSKHFSSEIIPYSDCGDYSSSHQPMRKQRKYFCYSINRSLFCFFNAVYYFPTIYMELRLIGTAA